MTWTTPFLLKSREQLVVSHERFARGSTTQQSWPSDDQLPPSLNTLKATKSIVRQKVKPSHHSHTLAVRQSIVQHVDIDFFSSYLLTSQRLAHRRNKCVHEATKACHIWSIRDKRKAVGTALRDSRLANKGRHVANAKILASPLPMRKK